MSSVRQGPAVLWPARCPSGVRSLRARLVGAGRRRWPRGFCHPAPRSARRRARGIGRDQVFAARLGAFAAVGAVDCDRRSGDAAPTQGRTDRAAVSSPTAQYIATVLIYPGLLMARMTRFRPQFWPTVFTVPVLLVLLGLGSWQIERLFWKRELIAQRQAALAAATAAVPRSLAEARSMEFRHVTDEGVFLHDKEIFLGATSEGGRQGYQVLTPLREPGGRAVFVNRGFIPADLKDPAKRSAGQIASTVRVQGFLRRPPSGRPSWVLPGNRADRNNWFWFDVPALSAS